MSLLENPLTIGPICLALGAACGYWLLRWKERSIRRALAIKEQSILEDAARRAEATARESRLQAAEDAQKLRRRNGTIFLPAPN